MRAARLLAPITLAVLAALAFASAASAQPLSGVVPDIGSHAQAPRVAPAADHSRLDYFNGPVMHSNRTHLIFWQPSGSTLSYDAGYQALVQTFLSQVAADSHRPTNVYSLSGQYHDGNGPAAYDSQFAGASVDTHPLPPNGCAEPPLTGPGWTVCLSADQIDTEMQSFIAANHLPTAAPDLYILVLPNGFGNCAGTGPTDCALGGSARGYCGYHTATAGGAIKYAVIPYNAINGHCQSNNPRPNGSTADPALSTISHEHNEAVTDPFGNAWLDTAGNENGDLCVSAYGPALGGSGATVYDQVIHGGHYYLQDEWSNDDGGCASHDEADRISSKGPGRVRAHHKAKFTGSASDPDGSIAGYFWSFGDGKGAHGKKVHHKYRKRGTYTVTLRIADSDGNWAFSTRTIKVR